jgi:hypothetical protein
MSCTLSSHVVVLTLIIPFCSRGKRLAFQNPHFGAPKNPRSKLQPEHADFSPSEDCTPRRLFGPPRKGSSKAKTQGSAQTSQGRSPSPAWEDDGEEEDTLGGPQRATLAQEFERIGKAEGGRASGGTVALPKEGTKVVKR